MPVKGTPSELSRTISYEKKTRMAELPEVKSLSTNLAVSIQYMKNGRTSRRTDTAQLHKPLGEKPLISHPLRISKSV